MSDQTAPQPLSAKNWFGKTGAGVILGFFIALGVSGLFRLAVGIDEAFFSTAGQVSMWLMAPVWALVISFVFFFSTGLRAWFWLALANIVIWGLLALFGGLGA